LPQIARSVTWFWIGLRGKLRKNRKKGEENKKAEKRPLWGGGNPKETGIFKSLQI